MKSLALALAATMAFSVIAPTFAEARPGQGVRKGKGVTAYRGRAPRYTRNRGNAAAGAAVVGIAGALIGGAIAAQNRPRYYEPAPVYGYGYAPAYGYGYAPAYGYGNPYYGY